MNFQEKLFETTADLRARAQDSFNVLNNAGREFNKVARRHAIEFVKQNSTIAAQVRDDVSTLARTTFASLTGKPAARKARTARKSGVAARAARKRARKAA